MDMVTLAVPADLLEPMRHLAMLRLGAADGVHRVADWTRDGAAFAAASLPRAMTAGWNEPPVRPDWDTDEAVDLTQAGAAMLAMQLLDASDVGEWDTARIAVVTGMEPMAALAALGLTRVEADL